MLPRWESPRHHRCFELEQFLCEFSRYDTRQKGMSSQRLFQPLIAMQGRDATRNATAERTIKNTERWAPESKPRQGRVPLSNADEVNRAFLSLASTPHLTSLCLSLEDSCTSQCFTGSQISRVCFSNIRLDGEYARSRKRSKASSAGWSFDARRQCSKPCRPRQCKERSSCRRTPNTACHADR